MDKRDIALWEAVGQGAKQAYKMVPSVLAGVFVVFSFCFVSLLTAFWFHEVWSPWVRAASLPVIDLGCAILAGGMLTSFYGMALKIVDNKGTGLQDLFSYFNRKFYRLCCFWLAYFLIVLIGSACLIVPGVYLALRLWLTPYVLSDSELGVFDAMRRSLALTEGRALQMLGLWLALNALRVLGTALIFILGFYLPGKFYSLGMYEQFSLIGWPLSMPIGMIATATVYRKLSKRFPHPSRITRLPL